MVAVTITIVFLVVVVLIFSVAMRSSVMNLLDESPLDLFQITLDLVVPIVVVGDNK